MSKNLMATALLFISFLSFSQQTASYTDHLVEYNKALELYNNNQFLAAQNLFSRVRATAQTQTIQADCAYYIANCAVRLNQQGADALIENFVKEHPTSVKKNEAYINVASYYFENGKYSRAQKYYAKLDPKAIPRKERDRFNFNNGYVYFKAKNSDQAKKYFNRVTTSKEYGAQAKYYLGFMAYEGDDYEAATQLFEEVKDEARYTEGLSYYQADMNFKLGNFQKAITLGSAQYERSNPRERSELAKIIGEGHFNLGNYAKAIPYLKEYKGKRGKWNNTDHYLLGYAHYKQGAYQEAINQFNKIIGGKNSVAQNAYYHLAESYLKLDQKQQALNAFKNASEMDFSLKIQEDASLNYAKLSYEIGNSYTAVPHVLLSFIETYPNNPQTENLKALLVGSYISSKNYKGAIQLLEKNTGYRDAATYQKVTFLRGIELYGQGNYERAIAHFDKSIENPEDKTYSARATFWKAESNYQRSHFEASLTGYNQFLKMAAAQQTPEYQNTAYNIAYNNFKLKKYNEAINGFKTYLQSATPNGARKTDSYLRLGDSYYVTSRYWPAMENYGKAIAAKNPGADYAAFQRATSYGFVDRNANKIKELEKFAGQYPKSIYRDDAWYELGNTYLAQGSTAKAITAYDKLLKNLPGSSYVSRTLLKKALIYDNAGKSGQALNLFKKVARQFPSTPEGLQAVASAKLIYIDQGRVSEYAKWVATLDFVKVEGTELDDATYTAAEQSYLQNKTQQAISRFEEYNRQFPNGVHAVQARFYLAQLYYANNKKAQSLPLYEFVANKERNEFTEQALARTAEAYLSQKNYAKALGYLKRLETEADFPQNIIFAQTNTMKASYEMAQYGQAVAYAEKVLNNPKIDNSIKSDAQVIIARAALKTNDTAKARTAYAQVAKIATGALAAEALYYDAHFKNKDGKYASSNAAVQKLAKQYSGHKLYGAKGLVLMARNFYALGDAYQATYILESVIKNFAQFPEVAQEAGSLLSQIKKAESKTNASVEVDNN